jgi:PGF-pre-PGF domain-containing protein
MKNIFTVFFFLILLMLAVPVYAQDDTLFTVYGRVYDTDGVTPLNGITVTLTIGGISSNAITTNGTMADGTAVSGYYYFPVLPSGAITETSMTISASTTGKSVSTTVARAATEPQKVDLTLSTGSGGTTPSSGNGGSGGGGGGGASGENFSNIQTRESREEIIAKDLPANYTFRTTEIPVYEIIIIGNVNLGLVNTQIELLKNTSTLVNMNPPGSVYKNLNIWVGTSGIATPKNIKDATIKFKVENSWLASGGFKDTDVVLVKWDGTEWIKLVTQPKNTDGSFTYFEGKTNAFSPFAIVAIKGYVGPTETIPAQTEIPVKPEITAAPTPTGASSTTTTIIVVVLAVVLVAAIYILKVRRR